MPSPVPPSDDGKAHEERINLALRRIREAKEAQAAAATRRPATVSRRAAGPDGRFRLDVSPFALAWQGLALFFLGLLVGIGLHVLLTVALG